MEDLMSPGTDRVEHTRNARSLQRLWLPCVFGMLQLAALFWTDPGAASSIVERARDARLSATDREIVIKALALAHIELKSGAVRPLKPIDRLFFLGSLAEPLTRHLASLVSWELDEQVLTGEQAANCRKLLSALIEWKNIYSLEPFAQAYDQIHSGSAIATALLVPDFLDEDLRDVLHKWVTSQVASLKQLPDVETVERMYGRPRSGSPNELFNFAIYALWQPRPYGISYRSRTRLVHLEGLSYISAEEIESGLLPASVALYLKGSKYLTITCGAAATSEGEYAKQVSECVVEKIVYSPIKNYSYVDNSASVSGLQLLVGVFDPGVGLSESGVPWLVEVLSTMGSDPRLRMRRLLSDTRKHDCEFRAIPGDRLPSFREILQ